MNSQTVLGLDPASKRPWAYAVLNAPAGHARPRLVATGAVPGWPEALDLAVRLGPTVVAVDAPLGFPLGQCCLEESCACKPASPLTGRACERELARLGIASFWTTKRTIIKPMVYAAIRLREGLEARGIPVLEVYPYAAKVLLFGRTDAATVRKSTPEGLAHLTRRVAALVTGLRRTAPDATHDALDAVLAAHTGCLHLQGLTETLGIPQEGAITIPRTPVHGTRRAAAVPRRP
jgi:predicted nuclease with RNAse H fold